MTHAVASGLVKLFPGQGITPQRGRQIMDMRKTLLASCCWLLLSACGSAGKDGTGQAEAGSAGGERSAECPPVRKGDGVLVSSRWDFEDLERFQNWQETIPPANCAGALGKLIPDFPEGYGLTPNNKPYVMNNEHVYLLLAKVPDQLKNEYGGAYIPENMTKLGLEILRFTPEEISKAKGWMADNPDGYRTTEVNGLEVYIMGAMALIRPGKPSRMGGGLVAFLDENIVVKIKHPDVFRPDAEALAPGGIVYDAMNAIIEASGR